MVNKRRLFLVLLLTAIMILGFATYCMASGEASVPIEQPAGSPPAFGNLYAIGWSMVNFLILLALIYKFAYGPINAMLEQRSNAIEGSLKHAEEVKLEVEQMRTETQINLAESRKEAQEIVAKAIKAAEEAKNDIIIKAREEADNIKIKAEADIKATAETAKLELKETAAVLAIMAAEKVLNRAITEEDHKKMVNQFVNEAGDLLC